MSSLRRMLAILDLFTPDRPVLTVEEVVGGFGHSRPTGYRHVAELCRAGLLSRVAGGLLPGPRIVELDYVLRQGDRTLEPSRRIARELRDECGCDTLLLMLHGGRVVTTHHERGSDPLTISFSRGRPVPMFRGAGSKAILAFMPVAQQRRLYDASREEVAAARLGESWEAFRAALQGMRRAGTTTSLGELDEPNVGVGAPILDAAGKPLGSLVLVLSRPRYAIADKLLLARMVSQAAARTSAATRDAGGNEMTDAPTRTAPAARSRRTRPPSRAARAACAALLSVLLPAGAAPAATFTWSSPSDALSLDPQAANDVVSVSVQGAAYEPLVAFSAKLEPEPRLAASWEQVAPDRWRIRVRPGVRFHEGQALTADDVVFSIGRGLSETSDTRQELTNILSATRVDDMVLEVATRQPDAILPRELTFLRIVNRAWAEAHGAAQPADMRRRQESYATRNANGTGPYRLVSREPDTETAFVRNPEWWDGTPALDRVVFRPVANDATRLAALLSGGVDMMEPVPVQAAERVRATPGFRLVEGPETRIVYLGFDQARAELPGSDVRGANPFRDPRVRRAVLQAIDTAGIEARVLRGTGRRAGTMVAPQVDGWAPALEERPPYDPDAARRLLAEAGYPNGFAVPFDCPNNRYVADEAVCRAIVPMLARVGIRAELSAQPKAQYFPKLFRHEASLWMFGWVPPTYDALHVLANTVASPDPQAGRGGYNFGGYRNAEVDALVARAAAEQDPAARRAAMQEALRLHGAEVGHVPLYQQALLWGVSDKVRLVQLPDGVLQLRWVSLEPGR